MRLRPLLVRVAALSYCAVLLALLLTPAPAALAPGPHAFLETERLLSGRMGIRDVIINIAVFVPAGLAIQAALRGALRGRVALALVTLLAGGGLSITAEVLQFAIPGRYSSAGDVAANLVGLAVGILLEHLVAEAPA